ncbi:YesL family protein [Anaerocolumna aminovalerica]|jgi:uncharacterized membrane protein YesL|uniref:Uncharacterized membrane protein YesL n=1 Tax=Anaerocolumna aminovalerica TaxID=1527 RepID=A0A1I5CVT3_9FIRM|nr:YesL family protein [Anaerocolumna aminovalerica]MBU5332170.1 DUF624 domain-containing protein [Anaerocolumna aminovalerica]MDU6265511.1 YesL family protein [Anaerocolumna aminovalerica]SFN91064.1 Uncharacterized membrane protein YesL [Anaerocolumna aminovalerica]
MNNLFSMDNGVFSFLGKMWDILVISILWLLLCLPIITIGPATTALYYTVVKVIRRERGYLFREFFHSFKMNFLNGMVLGIILMALYYILYIDLNFAKAMEDANMRFIFLAVFSAFSFIMLCGTVYVFPLLSRFTMGKLQILKTAFLMSVKHLPTTILMLLIVGCFAFIAWMQPIFLFFSSGICLLLCSLPLERVFKKYIPKSEDGEGPKIDEWYLE